MPMRNIDGHVQWRVDGLYPQFLLDTGVGHFPAGKYEIEFLVPQADLSRLAWPHINTSTGHGFHENRQDWVDLALKPTSRGALAEFILHGDVQALRLTPTMGAEDFLLGGVLLGQVEPVGQRS